MTKDAALQLTHFSRWLFEHHEMMHRLFENLAEMAPDDPERRDMMRLLAGELEIHEHVEDEVFYPPVRPVIGNKLRRHKMG